MPDKKGAIKEKIKHELLMPKAEKPEVSKSNCFICKGCKFEITEEFYYKCKYHETIFCERCVKNEFKELIPFKDAKHCLPNNIVKSHKWKDCIYERKQY